MIVTRRIKITQRARRDITGIRDYIAARDKQAAERVRLRIVHAIDLLAEHPFIGRMSDEPGVRIKITPPYPYKIYYRVHEDEVDILHVRHMARDEPEPGEF